MLKRKSSSNRLSPDLGHHSLLLPLLGGGLVGDHLHQVEEGAVHEPVGGVLHLCIEADDLAGDVAGPVAVDGGCDGPGLAAEAAEALVVGGVSRVLGEGVEIEVENTVDHDVLLHLVVPLPVPDYLGLDEVPHVAVLTLEGGGQVGGQLQAEGEGSLSSLLLIGLVHLVLCYLLDSSI